MYDSAAMNQYTLKFGLCALILALLLPPALLLAQEQPDVPCYYRPAALDKPWLSPDLPCLEEVTPAGEGGELAFTALAVGPDGTLYAARPLAGEVWALRDADGDGLPETPRLLVDGLTLPNALTWFEGSLYVAGGPHIYRVTEGVVTVLVDDLPAGPGYWTGGIALGAPDGDDVRIYAGTGAACDSCETGETGRGAIWSFALDGSGGRIEATGFRQPAALTFADGTLWAVDSAPAAQFDTPLLDEVNRVVPGADYGFPRCFGMDARAECSETEPPRVVLPTGSTPLGIAAYTGDEIDALSGSLLLALAGSNGRVELRGYALAAARPDESDAVTVLMPAVGADSPFASLTTDELNYRTVGFYPARVYGVAVHPRLGWVYMSLSGGRILAIRPQSEVVY